jgi:predicted  nucleic acid-binding Zn-ribbon protein
MWKHFIDLARQVLRLAEDTRENRADIKELHKEVRDLSVATERELSDLRRVIERLAYEIRRVDERGQAEREKLALQLENQLLHFESRLPPANTTDQDKK